MIRLYKYQEEARQALEVHLQRKRRALVSMASGLGKTILAAGWLKQRLKRTNGSMSGRQVLFLCHDNSILEQAKKEFRKVLGPQVKFGFFHGQRKDWDDVTVLFASFQTMHNWREVFSPDEFPIIMVDESHHGQAPSFKKVIEYFKPLILLGITATPDRMDKQDIRDIFGPEVVELTLQTAIVRNLVAPVEYSIFNDRINQQALRRLTREAKTSRQLSLKQVNRTLFVKRRDEEIVKIIRRRDYGGKKTIIFCASIEHANNFAQYLPNGKAYHSGQGVEENAKILKRFREGKLKRIIAVNKLNEGVDIPDAEIIIFLRCTGSKTIFLQQLGRGLRQAKGKHKVEVLDFVANCDRLLMLRELADEIEEEDQKIAPTGKIERTRPDNQPLHITGQSFNFLFTEEQRDVVELLEQLQHSFYPTYAEASRAARKLRIKTCAEYKQHYHKDLRLPSHPEEYYQNKSWINWSEFLGTGFYSYAEASQAAQKLGIKTGVEYGQRYYEDPRLPSIPDRIYKDKDWINWLEFLGKEAKNFYTTCAQASQAAQKLGIKTQLEYGQRYREDPLLPSNPSSAYQKKDWINWLEFLGKEAKNFYTTCAQASQAAQKLGIKTQFEYRQCYHEDLRLPSAPNRS